MQLQPGFCQCWQEIWRWSCKDKIDLLSGTTLCEIKFLLSVQWAGALYEHCKAQSVLEADFARLAKYIYFKIFAYT